VGTSLTDGEHRSNRCETTRSGDFETEDTCQNRKVASRLSKFDVVGHPFDSAKTKIPKVPFEGVYPSVIDFRASFVFLVPPYNPSGERMAAISWNPSSFFAIFLFHFLLEFLGLA
jgi:hypothetical protein